jgi:hypothetical protein
MEDGGWDWNRDDISILLLFLDFLNSFFADPYKITVSKGGLTPPLKT